MWAEHASVNNVQFVRPNLGIYNIGNTFEKQNSGGH